MAELFIELGKIRPQGSREQAFLSKTVKQAAIDRSMFDFY
jgi:hypothetical protein